MNWGRRMNTSSRSSPMIAGILPPNFIPIAPSSPDDADAGPAAGRIDLRSHLRLRWDAAFCRGTTATAGQRVPHAQALRPGAQPDDLGHRAHEPLSARHRRFFYRARRYALRPQIYRERPVAPLRCGARQSALFDQAVETYRVGVRSLRA